MLRRLKEQGITILVSTPYMDEAALCDRIAFMQEGGVLAIDTPAGITALFRKPLFAVRASQTGRLIRTLRSSSNASSVYAFGSAVHYTDKRTSLQVDELLSSLQEAGIEGAEAEQIKPGIEDTFMALMENRKGQSHE